MNISFKNEIAALSADLKKIKAQAIPKATVQALNRTVTGVRTDATKELRKESGVKSSEIRADLKIWRASRLKPVAELNARTGRAKNLINFVSPAQRKANYFNSRRRLKRGGLGKYKAKGVKARAWGESKTYDGTFIGRGRGSGKLLVFARTGKGRTPLKGISGPSIRNMFNKPNMQRKLKRFASDRFVKAMRAAVKNQIRQAQSRKKTGPSDS